jgi:hypothetical protein
MTARAATMLQFDDLPHASRTLLLATLELEIAQAKCANILDLAHKRDVPMQEIWRDVCRRTGQPRCTVPAPVMVSRDQWLAVLAAERLDAAAAAPVSDPPTPTPLKDGVASAGMMAVPAVSTRRPRAAAVPRSRKQHDRSHRAALVAGLVAVLALGAGAGALMLLASPNATVAPQASLQTPNAQRGEVVHGATLMRDQGGESARPESDPSSVQPPQGTIRRLDGISKSFSKR